MKEKLRDLPSIGSVSICQIIQSSNQPDKRGLDKLLNIISQSTYQRLRSDSNLLVSDSENYSRALFSILYVSKILKILELFKKIL